MNRIGVALAVALCACGKRDRINQLTEAEVAAIDGARTQLNAQADVLTDVTELAGPVADTGYQFAKPVSIAVRAWPQCDILVGDADDIAIHVFDHAGRYLRSLPLPDDARVHQSLYRIAAGPDGSIVATDHGRGWIAIADRGVLPWRILSPTRLVKNSRPGSVVAITADGRLIDHWFGLGQSHPDTAWREPLPLMRVLKMDGTPDGSVGLVHLASGETFTPALNRGIPVVTQDTVWFLRRVDARILAFDLRHRSKDPSVTIDLPVAFRIERPREVIHAREDVVSRGLGEHATAFSPAGNDFLVGLVLGYTTGTPEDPTPRVKGSVLRIDHTGKPEAMYTLRGAPMSLASTDRAIVAITAHPLVKSRQFAELYRLNDHVQSPGGAQRCKD